MSDYFAITLSYHNVAVSNLTAIYILLLHLGSIGQQHLQVHSLWGLKCLTSFFPEGSGFSILLGNGDHPCYFSFEFSFCSPLCSVCVLVFQSTWPSRTFIILKDTNLGTGICLISDFGLSHGRHRKS